MNYAIVLRLLSYILLTEGALLLLPAAASLCYGCLLYTSDAADEEDSVDLGGRRISKKKKKQNQEEMSENDNSESGYAPPKMKHQVTTGQYNQ